ncbi:MAG TPA: hypothetical protein VGQ36_03365 [Thermoanaerobaculia bacterium]|jgi:hypothetical protein|nr:hypothetical protein [Thermoanaerobaculia bacterium]
MKRTAAVLLFVCVAPLAFAKSRVVRSVLNGWHAPRCESVGLPWLRFIDDNGERRASSVDPPLIWRQPVVITVALAIGGTPNTLWAITSDGNIHQSMDAGCSWTVRASVPEIFAEKWQPRLAARHPQRVYAYIGKDIVRLTAGTVETFHIPDDLVLLEVDRKDALHIRAITQPGFAYESFDGASTWSKVGTLLPELVSAAFDPLDFDHIVAGGKFGGLRVSRDGGRTWSDGPLRAQTINDITFSPADPRVMWVDTWPGGVGIPSRLYKSTDGGVTLDLVDVNSSSVYYWRRLFAPHPRDAETFATHGAHRFGIRITGPTGTREWGEENVQDAVWSPSGTLYFVQLVIRSL